LWEEPADQPVDLSTAAVTGSVGGLDLDAGGQYQQRLLSYVAQPSYVVLPQYAQHAPHPLHPQQPPRLSSQPDQQHVTPGYAQPEAISLNVSVDAPESVKASKPATVQAMGADAASAIKPKRGRSKSPHYRRRRSSSFSYSSSAELRCRHRIKLSRVQWRNAV